MSSFWFTNKDLDTKDISTKYTSYITVKKKIIIINGVNLNQLGTREVDIYGYVDFETYFFELQKRFSQFDLDFFQSNKIEELVELILSHQYYDGIILNPGAYTHSSIVLADAIKAVPTPVVEVHISNLFGRENFRKKSMISSSCHGTISGFGLKGYDLAIFSFVD